VNAVGGAHSRPGEPRTRSSLPCAWEPRPSVHTEPRTDHCCGAALHPFTGGPSSWRRESRREYLLTLRCRMRPRHLDRATAWRSLAAGCVLRTLASTHDCVHFLVLIRACAYASMRMASKSKLGARHGAARLRHAEGSASGPVEPVVASDLRFSGADDGIRTRDPHLGKVVQARTRCEPLHETPAQGPLGYQPLSVRAIPLAARVRHVSRGTPR
jgi:hypothetical protein